MNSPLCDDAVGDIAAGSKPESLDAATAAATSDGSQSSGVVPSDPTGRHCASCNQLEEDPETPLKECIKCHSILYCSRDCQKADFKKHKKSCASLAQAHAQTSGPSRMQVTRAPPKTGGGRKGLQKWQFDT